jgi:hypothetical protein
MKPKRFLRSVIIFEKRVYGDGPGTQFVVGNLAEQRFTDDDIHEFMGRTIL